MSFCRRPFRETLPLAVRRISAGGRGIAEVWNENLSFEVQRLPSDVAAEVAVSTRSAENRLVFNKRTYSSSREAKKTFGTS